MSTALVDSLPAEPRANGHHFTRQAPKPHSAPAGVITTVAYVEAPADGEEIAYRVPPEGSGKQPSTNYETQLHQVLVGDVRKSNEKFSLDKQGFQLEHFEVPDDIDWSNEEEVKLRYWPLAAEAVKRASGATRVHVFDTTVRLGRIESPGEALQDRGQKTRAPVSRVHVDYTLRSGPGRLHEVLPEEAAELEKTPFAVIQLWRPLKGPVDESPLAAVDASTVKNEDLLTVRLDLPQRTGYTYAVKHDPGHKFWYVKGMTTEEALVFKCYDSRKNTARFTPHTAFKDPTTSPDAPPRQSAELRAYAFFEDLPEQPIAHDF